MEKDTIQNYDNLLKSKLNHLQIHPNYLPHIGKNFDDVKQRIMIVAESHYVDGCITADGWYNNPEEIYSRLIESIDWFKTRSVLLTYFKQRKLRKVEPALTIFKNLETAYKTVFKNSQLFDECVYINYFQRPAEKKGDSIQIDKRDSAIALDNLLVLIDVLKLDKIIFVSSKAYKDFIVNTTETQRKALPYIGSVPHPSASAWWNTTSTKYGTKEIPTATGREKFERIIKPKKEE
ncbi:hypothetical protein [Flavobacterium ovatum]|uniref:hypothetical protein n=1 Tax=Flavobacterium ovatum TaxID=1928857 RepID=UPI00344BD9D4